MNGEILNLLTDWALRLGETVPWPFFVFELIFWLMVLALSPLAMRIRVPGHWLATFDEIARSPRSPLWIGAAAFFARVAMLPFRPIPMPSAFDEFSYILGGKTLAAGTLTNPLHPLAPFFETFHVNVWPTYQSMYLPGQAAFLALGIRLFGYPWWGVLLSIALMCAAVTWMLRAVVTPRWALLGGIFCVLRYATFSYWVNSYWGGAVAALGGALALGGYFRLRKSLDWRHGLWMGIGLLLMAFTRPYEGAMFALPVGIACLLWLGRRLSRQETVAFAGAGAAVLLAGFAFLLYYNYRGTGHPLTMAYAINQKLYHLTQPFLFQRKLTYPDYHHLLMARNYIEWEIPIYRTLDSARGIYELAYERISTYYLGGFWPMLLMAIPGLIILYRRPKTRVLAISFVVICVALAMEAWRAMAHYMAPAVCVEVLLVITGLRWLRTLRFRGARLGRAAGNAAIALMGFWLVLLTLDACMDKYKVPLQDNPRPQAIEQERVRAELLATPGDHLVIVHDRDTAYIHCDWVHNDPDIDGQRIVWARDMGPYMDLYLLKYYKGRTIWWLDNDDGVNRVRPYAMRNLPDYVARQATHLDHRP